MPQNRGGPFPAPSVRAIVTATHKNRRAFHARTRFANGEEMMSDDALPRRKFLVGAGLAGTAVATGLTQPAAADPQSPSGAAANAVSAPPPQPEPQALLLLNETEHAFVVAAVDAIIPADELSPS